MYSSSKNIKKRKRDSDEHAPDAPMNAAPTLNFVLEHRKRANGPLQVLEKALDAASAWYCIDPEPGKQISCENTTNQTRLRYGLELQRLLSNHHTPLEHAHGYGIAVNLPLPMPWPNNLFPLVGKRFPEGAKNFSAGGKKNFARFLSNGTVQILGHSYAPPCCTAGCKARISIFIVLYSFSPDENSLRTAARVLGICDFERFVSQIQKYAGQDRVFEFDPIDSTIARRCPVSQFYCIVAEPHASLCVPPASWVAPWTEDTDKLRSSWLRSLTSSTSDLFQAFPSLPSIDSDDPTSPGSSIEDDPLGLPVDENSAIDELFNPPTKRTSLGPRADDSSSHHLAPYSSDTPLVGAPSEISSPLFGEAPETDFDTLHPAFVPEDEHFDYQADQDLLSCWLASSSSSAAVPSAQLGAS